MPALLQRFHRNAAEDWLGTLEALARVGCNTRSLLWLLPCAFSFCVLGFFLRPQGAAEYTCVPDRLALSRAPLGVHRSEAETLYSASRFWLSVLSSRRTSGL